MVLHPFKYCNFDDIILEHANRVLIDGKKPTQWSSCNIVPILKAGNLNEVDNYRHRSIYFRT